MQSRLNRSNTSSIGPASPWTYEANQAFLEQARWLVEWYVRRTEVFERRSSHLLTFSGVVIVLLPATLDPISKINIVLLRHISYGCVCGAAIFFVAAAGCALNALRRCWVREVSVVAVRDKWDEYLKRGGRSGAYIGLFC